MKKLFTLLLLLAALISARAANNLVLGDEITSLSQITDGTTSFVMKNSEGQFMCFNNSENPQNASMQDQATAFASNAFLFKLESLNNNSSAGSSIKDKYLIRPIKQNGDFYEYSGGSYLNSAGWVIFVLGLNNQFGQDKENGAVWDVTYTSGQGFSFKNVGEDKYMNNAGSTSDTQGYWKLYKVKEGTADKTIDITAQDSDDGDNNCAISTSNGVTSYSIKAQNVNVLFKNKNVDVTGYNQIKFTFAEATPCALALAVTSGNDTEEISSGVTTYTYVIPNGTTSLSEVTLLALWQGTAKTVKISSVVLTNGTNPTVTTGKQTCNITVGGESRSYVLYVPTSVKANPELVFSLHGANNSSNSGRPEYNAVADANGFIVVYPQGQTQNFYLAGMNGAGWAATGENNKEIDFLKAIIADVKSKGYAINEKKIYCSGFSNGGMMTYAAANAASDIFAAFASISGFPVNEFHHKHHGARPVPFLHIHGQADDFVNVAWYPTILDNMVARNGCNPIPTTSTGSATTSGGSAAQYTKYDYAAGDGGFPYTHYRVTVMGHNDEVTIGTKKAGQIMWEFMSQYSLDSECDNTLKWSQNPDLSGFAPADHGWTVSSDSKTLTYGDATPVATTASNVKHNVSHSLQFAAGDYQLRFNTTGTSGNKITIALKNANTGAQVFSKQATVGQKQYISYNIPSYGEYTITITKASASDKFTSLGAYMTTTAWAGATEVGQEGTSTPETPSTPESGSVTDLTASMFHKWSAADETGSIVNETVYPVYTINESTDMVYGYSTVDYLGYADLSEYGTLVIETTEGTPRCLFDRVTDGGTVQAETPRDSKYQTVNGTTYTIDLQSIVADYGFAHLHAIKGANYGNVTVTSMKLYPADMCLKVTTTGVQTNAWDWQVRYPLPTALETGKTYTIEMVAKAGAAVEIQPIAADNDSSNKDEWGGSADLQYLSASITTDWSTVSFETNGNYPYDYLYFNIGKVNGDFMISNIKITEKSSGTVILDNNMNDNSTWTKQQSALTLATVSTSTAASSGSSGSGSGSTTRQDFVFSGYDANSGYTLRPIRQYGKDLVYADDTSHKVTLHGVMDTPNSYFNNSRWSISDWNNRYNTDADVTNCLAYFETLLSAFVDHNSGSYVDIFRLHLDPAWTNDPNKTATGSGNEDDISRFSAERLSTYMTKLYWPIAKKAIDKGMYVIMRPPGVCPKDISVGGEYQEYLKTVWDIVSKDENVKKYAGQIMIELANEPVNVYDTDGTTNSYSRASVLHDFFQPIVDIIRANGFKGIILSSGATWQQSYQGYSSYPITGDNIGYAVHWYPGWYGTNHDKTAISDQTIIDKFQSSVPVVTSRPIVITEVDWSPEKSGTGHEIEGGESTTANYGTWATGTTSSFGKNFKATHDYFGNISMTLTHPYEYVDFDKLFGSPKVVTYSYQSEAEPKEACAYTCFKEWYPTLYEDHSIVDKYLTVTTTEAKTDTWDWQVRYPLPTALESGKTYTIEIKAKAANEANVAVWPTLSSDASNPQYSSIDVTTEWATHSFDITGGKAYDYLYVNIGKINGDFMISNIKITEKSSGIVVLNNNMNDNSTWTKTQNELTLATGPTDESSLNGSPSTADPNFHIYLCFGQSNMEGNATPEDVDKQNVPERFKMMAAVDWTDGTRTKGNWYTATPPLCRQGTGLTPADYFGRTMVERLPENVTVGVINVAVGGAPIELFDEDVISVSGYWDDKADWYVNYCNQYDKNPFRRLINMAKEAQKVGVIKGILLHQGESNNGQAAWPSKVKKVYDRICTELGLTPENTPLLAGEMVQQDMGGVCYAHNAVIAKLPETISNSYVISSANLPCVQETNNNGLHFTAAGYRTFGKRYANKMCDILGISYSDGDNVVTPTETNPLKAMFKVWTADDGTGTGTTTECTYNLDTSTDCVYGQSNVDHLKFADLSKYGKIAVTATEGSPRFFFNVGYDSENSTNVNNLTITSDNTTYLTKNGNTYTVDLVKIVEDFGYAHLNAIKASAYNTSVTVSAIELLAAGPIDITLTEGSKSYDTRYFQVSGEGVTYDMTTGVVNASQAGGKIYVLFNNADLSTAKSAVLSVETNDPYSDICNTGSIYNDGTSINAWYGSRYNMQNLDQTAKINEVEQNYTWNEKMGSVTKFEWNINKAGMMQINSLTITGGHTHTYGTTPVWTWAEDGSTASAKLVCSGNASHELSANAVITNAVKTAATCTAKGTTTYTAKVTLNGTEYTDTKDITDINALGHDLTYTDTGNGTHTKACSRCSLNETESHTGTCNFCNIYQLVDGNNYSNTQETSYNSVSYKRTIGSSQSGKYQALYVPMAVNVAELDSRITVYKIMALFYFDTNGDGNIDESYLRIAPLSSGILLPNHPYMFKASAADTYTFNSYDNVLYPAEINEFTCSTLEIDFTFKGNYTQQTFPTPILGMSGGIVKTIGGSMGAFRWYAVMTNKAGQLMNVQNAKIAIIVADDTTDIESTENTAVKEIEGIYSINGTKLQTLQKGVNIIRFTDGTTIKKFK